jgi:3-oxoacyl-[acyl-carrier-protein] synthase-3
MEMGAKIIGTGSYLPKETIDNEYLSTIVDTNDEWIQSRTGIHIRHINKSGTTASMAVSASLYALENAAVSPKRLDMILAATMSPDSPLPNISCEVQKEIGAVNAVCFDINAACSGFLFSLNTAYAYIQSGLCKTILVIGAETLSRIVNWKDRSTCILFGDGAGAAVIQTCKDSPMYFLSGSDGSKKDILTCPGYIQMNGQEVFRFAVKKVPESILSLLDQCNISIQDIKYFILHQANIRIIQAVAKRLNQPEEKFPTNLCSCGNTSAASIPILLDSINRKGLLTPGDKIILSGFGGGLTWGAALIEW